MHAATCVKVAHHVSGKLKVLLICVYVKLWESRLSPVA